MSNPSEEYQMEDDCCNCFKLRKGPSYFINQFHVLLTKGFYNLGRLVAIYKGYFILIPLFLTALSVTGFQRIHYEDDPEYLFAPSTGAARGERAVFEENFFLNFTELFDPTRITRTGRFARFIVVAKDGGTIFRSKIWDDVVELDKMVKEVKLVDGKKTYGFEDLCARKGKECFKNEVLDLANFIHQVENGSMVLHYPINFEPFLLPHFLGGVETKDNGELFGSAKATQIFYWIKTQDEEEDQRGMLWEREILSLVENKTFEDIRVVYFTSRTLEDELERNTNSVKPYVGVTLTIMTLFSVVVSLSLDWVRGKPYLGIVGVVTSVLSSFASFGFLIYIGVPFIGINMAAPFLMLGIGIDDSFVMLGAWRRTSIQDPVPDRLAATFSEAAVSITITSLTDMISFFIGIMTPFPSVQIFCIYTGTAVIVTYLWHITLFGGFLALSGYAEQNQRHSLICIKVKAKSQTEDSDCLYTTFCSGGINKVDPWNPRDNRPHAIMLFFKKYLGRLLNIPAIKSFVICIFILYLGGAVYGCLRVKEGLEKRRLSRYDSYSVDFYDLEDAYFREFPYSVQVAVTGNITYSDPETKKDFLELLETFENQTYVHGEYTQSVIRYWYNFLDDNREWLDFNITDEKSFISYLREVYVSDPTDVFNLDIRYNDDYTKILSTRFVLQTYKLADSNADKNMMEGLREIARNSKFNVTVFNPLFIFFDQLVLVRSLSIQAISLAAVVMMFISLIFIPNPWCSMWVGFSIISIEVGVVGYMTLWDVNLDSISMMNLIMCIGFSVDFSAHICYAYLTAKVNTPAERLKESLFALGFPIIQGGLSTILGVIALIFAPSYIFVTFFKIVFLVIFFGMMHGLFLLPVLLSILGPGSFKKQKPESKLYDPSFLNREITPVALPPFNNVHGHHRKVDQDPGYQPQPFAYSPKKSEEKYTEFPDKDMGLGTSGEDSSEGSLQENGEGSPKGRGMTVVELRTTSRQGRDAALPIKEVYSNRGYVSDAEDENSASRRQRHYYRREGSQPPSRYPESSSHLKRYLDDTEYNANRVHKKRSVRR